MLLITLQNRTIVQRSQTMAKRKQITNVNYDIITSHERKLRRQYWNNQIKDVNHVRYFYLGYNEYAREKNFHFFSQQINPQLLYI